MRKTIVMLFLSGFVAGSCGGTETGNPFNVETSIGAYVSPRCEKNKCNVGVRIGGRPFRIDHVWAHVGTPRLYQGKCGSTSKAVVWELNRYADLLDDGFREHVAFDQGDYCDGDLTFSQQPTDVIQETLVIEGELASGVPFRFVSNNSGPIDFQSKQPFAIDKHVSSLSLSLDLSKVFNGLDLNSAKIGEGNIILLNDYSNTEIRNRMEAQLRPALTVLRDDGELENIKPPSLEPISLANVCASAGQGEPSFVSYDGNVKFVPSESTVTCVVDQEAVTVEPLSSDYYPVLSSALCDGTKLEPPDLSHYDPLNIFGRNSMSQRIPEPITLDIRDTSFVPGLPHVIVRTPLSFVRSAVLGNASGSVGVLELLTPTWQMALRRAKVGQVCCRPRSLTDNYDDITCQDKPCLPPMITACDFRAP